MQNGIFYGLWGVVAVLCYLGGFTMPLLSAFPLLLIVFAPFFLGYLTFRFRKVVAPEGPFAFSRGFWHALLTSTYAAMILAVVVFVYLKWLDHGFIFDQYEALFSQPEFVAAMKVGGMDEAFRESYGMTFLEMIRSLRHFSPGYFALGILETLWIFGVIVSLVIGLITKRN